MEAVGMAVRLSRAERREQTRQELLTAAEACFVSQGFHASAEHAFDQLATGAIQRPDPDDGWRAVFFEFWAHVLRHPELRDRFAAIHARFLEPLADAVRQLAEDRGLALPPDVTANQVVLAWNAMEIGLGLERLTQPQTVDVAVARRMGWLLLDAVLGAAQPSAGNNGPPQDRRIQ